MFLIKTRRSPHELLYINFTIRSSFPEFYKGFLGIYFFD